MVVVSPKLPQAGHAPDSIQRLQVVARKVEGREIGQPFKPLRGLQAALGYVHD